MTSKILLTVSAFAIGSVAFAADRKTATANC
jgi:hypothetical protein